MDRKALLTLLSSAFLAAAQQPAESQVLFDTYLRVCPAALDQPAGIIDALVKDGWINPGYKVDVPAGRNASLNSSDGSLSVVIQHLPFPSGVYTICDVGASGSITMDDIEKFKSEFPAAEAITTQYGDGTYDVSWLLTEHKTFTMLKIENRTTWARLSVVQTSYSSQRE